MRTLLVLSCLCLGLSAQGLLEVNQTHLELGLLPGSAIYSVKSETHIPGREPVSEEGKLRLAIEDVAEDGSGWLSYQYEELKRDGKPVEPAELAQINGRMAARIHVSARWEVLSIEGELVSGREKARQDYHDALDRLMQGDGEALGQVIRRGLRLSRILASEQAVRSLARAQARGDFLQVAFDSLLQDPSADPEVNEDRTIGPIRIQRNAAVTGHYLLGVRPLFAFEDFRSFTAGPLGVEAREAARHNHWGLLDRLDAGFDFYAGPFGGSVVVNVALKAFVHRKAEVILCASCGGAAGPTSSELADREGRRLRFCSEHCELNFVFGGALGRPTTACEICGKKTRDPLVLTDAQGKVHPLCSEACERRLLFGAKN